MPRPRASPIASPYPGMSFPLRAPPAVPRLYGHTSVRRERTGQRGERGHANSPGQRAGATGADPPPATPGGRHGSARGPCVGTPGAMPSRVAAVPVLRTHLSRTHPVHKQHRHAASTRPPTHHPPTHQTHAPRTPRTLRLCSVKWIRSSVCWRRPAMRWRRTGALSPASA